MCCTEKLQVQDLLPGIVFNLGQNREGFESTEAADRAPESAQGLHDFRRTHMRKAPHLIIGLQRLHL